MLTINYTFQYEYHKYLEFSHQERLYFLQVLYGLGNNPRVTSLSVYHSYGEFTKEEIDLLIKEYATIETLAIYLRELGKENVYAKAYDMLCDMDVANA